MSTQKLRIPLLKPSQRVVLDDDAVIDFGLLFALLAVSLFGAVMITSASMPVADRLYGDPFYFASRQSIFLMLGFIAALVTFRIPMSTWEKAGPALLVFSILCLGLVLIPGIGKEVNGSRRWIDLGIINIQVSEAVKLFIVVYMAGYLVRRGELVQTTVRGFTIPLSLMLIACGFLLAEPDFGASVVIVATATIMLFVAGARLLHFTSLIVGVMAVGFLLIWISDYRRERLLSFTNPWADPFDTGFQLTQSLIAIGSGSWKGVGLGSSIQKLSYLPESHTDFVFAIIGEELGLIGTVAVVVLFTFIVWRSFAISRAAHEQGQRFAGYVALGIGTWIGLQSFINIGVNLGVLPTKGITLPMISYGGSSALIFSIGFAILLRVDYEIRQHRVHAMQTANRSRSREKAS